MDNAQSVEEAKALLRKIPKRVHFVAVLASIVGLLNLVRFCTNAWAGKLLVSKAIFYGFLIFGLLSLNGFSLIRKSRSGYVIVAIVAVLPMLGLLAQSLHLFVLLLSGAWMTDKISAVTCVISICQLLCTGALLFFLFSREVRSH